MSDRRAEDLEGGLGPAGSLLKMIPVEIKIEIPSGTLEATVSSNLPGSEFETIAMPTLLLPIYAETFKRSLPYVANGRERELVDDVLKALGGVMRKSVDEYLDGKKNA